MTEYFSAKTVEYPNDIPHFLKYLPIAKPNSKIINTIASIWLKNMPGYLSLDYFYSFPLSLLSKNTSLFGTDDVHGQISRNLKAIVYQYNRTDEDNCEILKIHSLLCVVLYLSVLCFSSLNTFSFCCAYLYLRGVRKHFPSRKETIKLLFKIFFQSRRLSNLFSFKQVITLLTSFNS